MTQVPPNLQHQLGVSAEQTVVFGDYLNDLEMLDSGEMSFAMANAHPQVISILVKPCQASHLPFRRDQQKAKA